MAREYPEYRFVLADLKDAYGDKIWLTVSEIAKRERRDPDTIHAAYSIPKGVNGINRAVLACRICEIQH